MGFLVPCWGLMKSNQSNHKAISFKYENFMAVTSVATVKFYLCVSRVILQFIYIIYMTEILQSQMQITFHIQPLILTWDYCACSFYTTNK